MCAGVTGTAGGQGPVETEGTKCIWGVDHFTWLPQPVLYPTWESLPGNSAQKKRLKHRHGRFPEGDPTVRPRVSVLFYAGS